MGPFGPCEHLREPLEGFRPKILILLLILLNLFSHVLYYSIFDDVPLAYTTPMWANKDPSPRRDPLRSPLRGQRDEWGVVRRGLFRVGLVHHPQIDPLGRVYGPCSETFTLRVAVTPGEDPGYPLPSGTLLPTPSRPPPSRLPL